MVFVFSWLVYFIQHGVLKVHLCCSTCQNFLPFKAGDASLYVCATAGLPTEGPRTAGHSSSSVVHPPQRRTRVPVPLSPHPGQHTFFSFVIGALLMDFLVFISLMIRFDFHFPNAQWCWKSFHFTHGYWSFAYLLSSSSLEKCLLNPLTILKSGGFFQWLMFLCFNSCQAYFTWRRVWFEPPI